MGSQDSNQESEWGRKKGVGGGGVTSLRGPGLSGLPAHSRVLTGRREEEKVPPGREPVMGLELITLTLLGSCIPRKWSRILANPNSTPYFQGHPSDPANFPVNPDASYPEGRLATDQRLSAPMDKGTRARARVHPRVYTRGKSLRREILLPALVQRSPTSYPATPGFVLEEPIPPTEKQARLRNPPSRHSPKGQPRARLFSKPELCTRA